MENTRIFQKTSASENGQLESAKKWIQKVAKFVENNDFNGSADPSNSLVMLNLYRVSVKLDTKSNRHPKPLNSIGRIAGNGKRVWDKNLTSGSGGAKYSNRF